VYEFRFALWLENDQDLGKLTATVTRANTQTKASESVYGWKKRGFLEERYRGDKAKVPGLHAMCVVFHQLPGGRSPARLTSVSGFPGSGLESARAGNLPIHAS
jgi:hypothetical protein